MNSQGHLFQATPPAPPSKPGMALGKFTPRDYQLEAVENVREALARLKAQGKRQRIILHAPTGSGKTLIAAIIASLGLAKGSRILFVAYGRNLIFQSADKFAAAGLGAYVSTIISDSGGRMHLSRPLQVASIDTLRSRAIDGSQFAMPPADLVIVDEAHGSTARTFVRLLMHYAHVPVIGLTATPAGPDGLGLGFLYEEIVPTLSMLELQELGHLVPLRYHIPSFPDLTGVRLSGGDYDPEQVTDLYLKDTRLVSHPLEWYLKHGEGRKFVIFAMTVRHSKAMANIFNRAGIKTAHVDANISKDRNLMAHIMNDPSYRGHSSFGVFAEGTDYPDWAYLIDCRPTKQTRRHVQKVGRVTRPAPGKVDAIVADHAGNWYRHGYVEDITEWSLDGEVPIHKKVEARVRNTPDPVVCVKCKYVHTPGIRCPNCGHMAHKEVSPEGVEFYQGQLMEVKRVTEARSAEERQAQKDEKAFWASEEGQARFMQECLGAAERRGLSKGWAANMFKERYRQQPSKELLGLPSMPPSKPTAKYLTSIAIRKSKRGQR